MPLITPIFWDSSNRNLIVSPIAKRGKSISCSTPCCDSSGENTSQRAKPKRYSVFISQTPLLVTTFLGIRQATPAFHQHHNKSWCEDLAPSTLSSLTDRLSLITSAYQLPHSPYFYQPHFNPLFWDFCRGATPYVLLVQICLAWVCTVLTRATHRVLGQGS